MDRTSLVRGSSIPRVKKIIFWNMFCRDDEVSQDTFFLEIEKFRPFLMPIDGPDDEAEVMWQSYLLANNKTEVPEEGANFQEYGRENPFGGRASNPDELYESETLIRVNKAITRQGIHPALLEGFWKLFVSDSNNLNINRIRVEQVLLSMIPERIKMDKSRNIGVDWHTFEELCQKHMKEVFDTWDWDSYLRLQQEKRDYEEFYKRVERLNIEYRQKRHKESFESSIDMAIYHHQKKIEDAPAERKLQRENWLKWLCFRAKHSKYLRSSNAPAIMSELDDPPNIGAFGKLIRPSAEKWKEYRKKMDEDLHDPRFRPDLIIAPHPKDIKRPGKNKESGKKKKK
eukprot:GHVL01008864.1.p2 GENE.GHVL01008864.1~~GHVL01008864.1.p2  ORF type:complete len:342 (-),score=53.50 GHVL01008864.1:1107-2132(-)